MLFCVYIHMADGRNAYLAVGDRTCWSKSRAQKHARDCRKMIADGTRPEWIFVEVVED